MKRRNFVHRPGCAVEATLDLIDGKWKGVILFHLQAGTQRFGELRRRMPGITQRMLTKQLRALEDDNLVIRKVYAEVPPRVEYTLSEIGESLRPVIDTLKAWGESHQERLSCAPAADAESPEPRSLSGEEPTGAAVAAPAAWDIVTTPPACASRSHQTSHRYRRNWSG
jgi:DNA-binding HxlR family transcriptional regulator